MEHLQNNNNEVLQQMEKYTFDEPLNVAVIYEEPDDEELIVPIQKSTNGCNDYSLSHTTKNNTTTSETQLQQNIIEIMQNDVIQSSIKSVEDYELNNGANNQKQLLYSNILGMGKECPIYNNNSYDRLLTYLDTLSENLIYISEAGFATNYFKFNEYLYDKAKKKYLYLKIKIFKASFNIAANIILPQENNRSFLERFISGTVSIARCKSLNCISKEIIECLIIDLIIWTKHEILRLKTMNFNTYLNQEPNQNTTASDVQYPGNNRLENMTNISNSIKRCLFPNTHWESTESNSTVKPKIHNESCSKSDNFISEDSDVTLPKRLKGHNNQVQLNCHNNVREKQFQLPFQNEHEQINRPMISLRSVSRDSGIESPTCNNWQLNNPMEAINDNFTRSNIENVNMAPGTTSTNLMYSNTPPQKGYLSGNYCIVCQKSAKTMCKDCERQFYCCLECQSADWNIHKHFCILLREKYWMDSNKNTTNN